MLMSHIKLLQFYLGILNIRGKSHLYMLCTVTAFVLKLNILYGSIS